MRSKRFLSAVTAFAMCAAILAVPLAHAEGETIYTTANGWTLNGSIEQQDGSLAIVPNGNNPTVFSPALEYGKKYSITYDVTGLTTGETWHYPFRIKLSAGSETVDGALAYRMGGSGRWTYGGSDPLVANGTNGTNEIIFDTVTGDWATYALGNFGTSGTFADPSGFAIKFYRYQDDCQAYISNVTVTDITPAIYNSANGWSLAAGATETSNGELTMVKGVDSWFTPTLESGKIYEISYYFDYQGTGESGTWNKPFQMTLADDDETISDPITYYRTTDGLWATSNGRYGYGVNSGKQGTVKVYINTATGEWSTNIFGSEGPASGSSYGNGAVTLTGFNSVSGFKIGFRCQRDSNPATYPTYISNVTVTDLGASSTIYYTKANGWTLNGSEEQQDGSLAIKAGGNTPTVFSPALVNGRKYSITYDVTGLTTDSSNTWAYPFRVKVSAGGEDVDGALAYRMGGTWESGANSKSGTNGTNEIIYDTYTGEWETYALGKLANSGTFADPSGFAIKFYRWSSLCQAYISNVKVTDITPAIYNSVNGWSLGAGAEEQQNGSLKLAKTNYSWFTPTLVSGKMYEISYDVAVTVGGDSIWAKPFQMTVADTDESFDNILNCYCTTGVWADGARVAYGATGTSGTNKVYINTVTGEWSMDILGTGKGPSGSFTNLSGFKLGFRCEPYVDPETYPSYISNVTVTDLGDAPETDPVIYTRENGWTIGGAKEQQDGSLKLGKGESNAACFTPELEAGKVYEITYDVSGLLSSADGDTVPSVWKKPITVTLTAGGQTEVSVLTYRMSGAWRDAVTDQGYVIGSNGQNKIVIDTASGEWETYALGTKATYSGFTSTVNAKTKTYNAFSDVTDFTIKLYAYDRTDDFETPYISNVRVTEVVPSSGDDVEVTPVLLSYDLSSNGSQIDTPDGLSSFNANLHFKPNGYMNADVAAFAVVYNAAGNMVGMGMTQTTIGGIDIDVTVPVTLSVPYSDQGNTLRIFVWDGISTVRPYIESFDPVQGIAVEQIEDDVDLHNDLMREYLDDDYENVLTYAWGSYDRDDPKPVTFSWSAKSGLSSYTLEVSEAEDLSDARIVTTDKCSADVYNLKIGSTYYYRVSATDGNEIAASDILSFTTNSDAPRCIQALGLDNGRDVGGWQTSDGGRVKQGMVYRSYCFDYVNSSGATVTMLKPEGIDVLVNELGIKTEVDLRGESEKTSSILGAGVNYYRYGMNYSGDYLSGNKTAIKNVFETLADPDNYPITMHCQAGADRTGAVIYLLNGLLGVSKDDLLRDYLITNFSPCDQSYRTVETIANRYVKTLDEYEGNTLSDKIYNYLHNEIGVSTNDLDFIREYLTEDAEG